MRENYIFICILILSYVQFQSVWYNMFALAQRMWILFPAGNLNIILNIIQINCVNQFCDCNSKHITHYYKI
jgi:hypothetical protein